MSSRDDFSACNNRDDSPDSRFESASAACMGNLGAAIFGMYAAVKIFRHNGIDPHRMVDAIIKECDV